MTLTGSGRSSNNKARGPIFRRSVIEKSQFALALTCTARNLVERFLNKVKQCRRIATRYDKLAANYLGFVKLAAIRIWLRTYESTPYNKLARTAWTVLMQEYSYEARAD
jgi:hypothetical protein